MKFIHPLLLGAVFSVSFAQSDTDALKTLELQVKQLQAQIEALKANQDKISTLQASLSNSTMGDGKEVSVTKNADDITLLKKQVGDIKKHTAGDNVKWDIDFRTAYDNLNYKINGVGDKHNGVWTNKLILGMSASPIDNLVFRGALGVYKIYGQNNVAQNSYFQNFDWYGTQKPSDNAIRLREAYFLYMNEVGDMPYTVSFGRRPSTDGFLTNLRADNAEPKSPIGHNINMEFDGASFKFDLDKITGIPGFYAKLCLGRGFSDTTGAYSMNMSTMGFNPGYINADQNPNMDLAGLILQLYDNGQYKLMGNYFIAKNLMDMDITGMGLTGPNFKFSDVGDMSGGALSLQVNGIGDGWSDFLDDTIFFASYAFSKTDPNSNKLGAITPMGTISPMSGMLGSQDSKFGSSIYLGLQTPGIFEGDRFGLEYNRGSKYWRSFTYGEDTLIGSKLAARGNAYEAYYTKPIAGKNLVAGLSYAYIDYDYTGSDTFFGWTGTPMDVDKTPGAVKSAQQVRLSLRYRY
ncbi:DUF3373 family protein [Campylobacter sp. RM12920]|uniref:DUF3373 family protein n=1 Tax=Campylobacter californiensis TaxID=1032243 RepID=A0ABD4JKP5_9BACT|nr:DUF3373 family protein [Campylobacter sp. RM12919]MBE2988394.1 DUF3373 family protein [Campylobacter sp. RM12920]